MSISSLKILDHKLQTRYSYGMKDKMIFGTAVSAHQTEGNNTNSDWWHWEQSKDYKTGKDKNTGKNRKWPLDPSGIACDTYNRYEEDFDLAKELGTDAIRVSVEWARIEPQLGVYDTKEIEHYKKVLSAAKARELKTFVTLHHFTNPFWFSNLGGWLNKNAPKYFADYANKCAIEFGQLTDAFLTINEPQVYAGECYINGEWPPCHHKNYWGFIKAQWHFVRAHKLAYKKIKAVNKHYQVGFVNNLIWHHSQQPWYLFWDHVYSRILNFLNADSYMLLLRNHLDLMGVNYYFSGTFKNFKSKNKNYWVSDMNWWIFPLGLFYILDSLRKYRLPIYITENGLADATDATRSKFLREMIDVCKMVVDKGVNLKGYFYWSLLDNYEWHQGYWPKFGLVNIDRENDLKRIKRPSFEEYKRLIEQYRQNELAPK